MSKENIPNILPLMVGTAGHVDHGKTSLVRNLTGRDPDTHKEEKERGMTIDFGVVPCPLNDNNVIGIIDVPGHEDFIRNMVAGASSIDILMLVIAADDVVMPQTREHLQIAKTLGMVNLFVVLTKTDLVDAELLSIIKEDIEEFLANEGYTNTKILEVNNLSTTGIEAVRAELSTIAANLKKVEDPRVFRMDIRGVFNPKGFGTVVTGVPISGELKIDDEVDILPLNIKTTVKGIQNYRHLTNHTSAHISSAINLRDVDSNILARGMCLTKRNYYSATRDLVLVFTNDSKDSYLPKRFEAKFHSGTAGISAKVKILDSESCEPGQTVFLRIKLNHAGVFCAGDKYILRLLSPGKTIGGGTVLSANANYIRRATPALIASLDKARESIKENDYLLTELHASVQGIFSYDQFAKLSFLEEAELKSRIKSLEEASFIKKLSHNTWILLEKIPELQRRLKKVLSLYHQLNKYVFGVKSSYVCELFNLSQECYSELIKYLTADGEIKISNSRVALKDFKPQISAKEIALREQILKLVTEAGINTIARVNIIEKTSATEKEVKLIAKILIDEGLITAVGNNYILSSILNDVLEKMLAIFKEHEILELNLFREKTGLSRNIAVIVLES
ncbi:MAG: selenocysteine-specific translation elongation factor, partial [Proteobacteria bacterium]|nr:selenocysteine-specific translation elongation factor [Pseudomonadota bacterium]